MLSVIFRTVFMYIIVIFSMRVMGKKNLGEFQPSDLVSTILISNLTSIVIEESHLPVAYSISAILIIMALEVIISLWVKKSEKFAHIAQGKSVILIRDGVINQKAMKELRFSVDDILEALRGKDIFYLEEAKLAVVETTGTVNVYKDPNANSNIKKASVPPMPVIVDSKIIYENLDVTGLGEDKIKSIMLKNNLNTDKILLLTLDGDGQYNLTLKENI